MEKTNL